MERTKEKWKLLFTDAYDKGNIICLCPKERRKEKPWQLR